MVTETFKSKTQKHKIKREEKIQRKRTQFVKSDRYKPEAESGASSKSCKIKGELSFRSKSCDVEFAIWVRFYCCF